MKVTGAFTALLRRELGETLARFRFRATAVLVPPLMILAALLAAVGYENTAEEHQRYFERSRQELENVTVAQLAVLHHPATKPPWKLAFLTDGAQTRNPDLYRLILSPWETPELGRMLPSGAGFLNVGALDWLFVINVVLSLTAFLLSHDAIAAPKARHRLKLVLAHGGSRLQVLTAKLVAIWVGVATPFLMGALVSLATIVLAGLRFTGNELAKISGVTALGLWGCAIYTLLGFCISTFAHRAEHSLVTLVLLWVTIVVAIPSASSLVVRWLEPIPTEREFRQELEEIRRRTEAGEEAASMWRPHALARSDDYAWERRSAMIQNRRHLLQEARRWERLEQQLTRVSLAHNLGFLSPTTFLEDLAERIAGSGPFRDRRFFETIRSFRSILARHVLALDHNDPESPHLAFFPSYLSDQPVDARTIPRFVFTETTWAQGLRSAGWHLTWLAAMTCFLALTTLLAFFRLELL